MESLRKALDILEVFITHDGEAILSDIADETKLNISTIHGILSYMRERGYIVQKEKRGKYTLGYKYLEFSDVIMKNIPLGDVALPHMRELNQITHETVSLVTFFESVAAVLVKIESNHDLRVAGLAERYVPLYCTGFGKVLLAHKSEEYLQAYFTNTQLNPRTPNTITNTIQLQEQLEEVRRRGYAIDNQETGIGVINIASPIKDRKGEVLAAVGILGPTVRINDNNIPALIAAVKDCAIKISQDLGYKGFLAQVVK